MKKIFFTTSFLLFLVAGLFAQEEDFKGKIGKTLKDSEQYWPEPVQPPADAPNVLVWLIDDMGFGHASAFGGLTPTPTLDKLSDNGLRFNNFHTTALCSPSRACNCCRAKPSQYWNGVPFADGDGISWVQCPSARIRERIQ